VTLRGDRMWEFLDRLLSVALPRIRDFRGLSAEAVRRTGNYTFGLNEQVMFHEIDQDKIDRVRGMDITVVTSATTDDEGRALLQAFSDSPSRRPEPHGEEVSSDPEGQAEEAPSSPSAPTPAATSAAVRTRCTASSACAGSACARWPTRGELPGVTKSSW
jgi:hypothetical protein